MSFRVLVIITPLVIALGAVTAQEKKQEPPRNVQSFKFDAGNSVIIRELAAVVTADKGTIAVKFIPPKDRRPKEVAAEDIEAGDEVGMANGKRIATVAELRKQYDEAPVGSEFKLGIRRNGEPRIVKFVKKDPKEAMQGGMTVTTSDGKGGLRFFPALGIGLELSHGKVVIAKALPNILTGLKEGDQIESLNGKNVNGVEDFEKELDATKVGNELKFGLVRENKKVSASAARPKPAGQIMFKND